MRSLIHDYLIAAGFLTRMAPARVVPAKDLGRTITCFPLVGMTVGLVLTLPWIFGLAAGFPWVQAWLWLAGALYLTRGLHWDGWADLCDAWGSGARDERFWEVIKDSRLGAFGCMGLFMGLAGQLLLLHHACQSQAWGALIWSPVLGRTAAPALAWIGRDLHRPGLGKAFLSAATARRLLLSMAVAALLGLALVPGKVFVSAWALLLLGLMALTRLAKDRQGLNGDFLGAAIIWGELSALLASLF